MEGIITAREPIVLASLAPVLRDLAGKASLRNHRLIARAQRHESLTVLVQDGAVESLSSTSFGGIGLQVFLEDGGSALGAVDRIEGADLAGLLDRTATAAEAMRNRGLDPAPEPFPVGPLVAEIPHPACQGALPLAPQDFEQQVRLLGKMAADSEPDLVVRVGASVGQDLWRIARWDGTRVGFVIPRGQILLSVTARGGNGAVTQRDHISGGRLDLFQAEQTRQTLLEATARAARAARKLIGAPPPPSGSCPLVIDHALAKGLAHEALGHAAEADSFASSILASNGQFRRGERVAPERISIVDEPIVDDHAYQPISAHGVLRRKTTIVREGLLHEALTDLFSTGDGPVPLRGSARVQDYASPPIPRMSNIRIEVAQPRPTPAPWREITAGMLRDLLGDAGVFERHNEVVFLSGYTGGQVNPRTGAFVFNSLLSYRLRADSVELCQPAVFSGSALAALRSIDQAFGPLTLDAIGQCGKAGQHVPSSGGSHAFVYFEPDEQVLVGGRSGP